MFYLTRPQSKENFNFGVISRPRHIYVSYFVNCNSNVAKARNTLSLLNVMRWISDSFNNFVLVSPSFSYFIGFDLQTSVKTAVKLVVFTNFLPSEENEKRRIHYNSIVLTLMMMISITNILKKSFLSLARIFDV